MAPCASVLGRTLWKWKWIRAWARPGLSNTSLSMNPGALLIRKQRGIRSGSGDSGHWAGAARRLVVRPGQRPTPHHRLLSGRHLTHLDVPTIEVHFLEVDDGYGPFGAKTVGSLALF